MATLNEIRDHLLSALSNDGFLVLERDDVLQWLLALNAIRLMHHHRVEPEQKRSST